MSTIDRGTDRSVHQQPGSGDTAAARILYATDPICSHCWAMEPAWRRFLYHYGAHLEVTSLYGGLLPGWEGFRDSAGIQSPADIPPHWEEVAVFEEEPWLSRCHLRKSASSAASSC